MIPQKRILIPVLILVIGLLVWLTGLATLIYKALTLCLAFVAQDVTPQHLAHETIGAAWAHWWQPGLAVRWSRYQHDSHLQTLTRAYAILLGMGLLAIAYKVIPWRRMTLKVSAAHGTAHWATLKEAEPFLALRGKAARQESQLPLGTYRKRPLTLKERQLEEHVFIVGPSGKGKTAGVIVPGILSERGRRSLVIIDPKQEIVRLTAGAVARHMQIQLFAPTQPERSQRYNPLAFIKTMEDAEDFAACWVSNTGRSSDPFWDRNTELLITAAVLHLRSERPDAPFSALADLLSGTSFDDMDALLASSPSPEARRIAGTFMKDLKLNEKTAGGVLTDVAGRFFRVHNPKVRTVTAINELDFSAMIDEPTALYLSIPSSAAERLQPLTACLLMQMFATFIERAENAPGGRLPRGVTCYLDEFANAGRIPHMSQRITMLRSSRVALVLAVQNYAQLDALYGEEQKKTILSNASTHLVLPGSGQEEVEFYSKRIGNTTAIGQTMSHNALAREGDTNQGQQEIGRKLVMPEELRTMKRGQLLLLSDTIAPLIIQNTPYYRSRLARLVNLPFTPSWRAARPEEEPAPPVNEARKEPPHPEASTPEAASPGSAEARPSLPMSPD
ncbi:MAG TPA: type IV secretory system conjugative DNA transfer family protein [Ktedonobacteraceae bacterium]|nr:type IV secretory system conjugative DNA transfer family protein [Ktedonobacteraceae bacterium]